MPLTIGIFRASIVLPQDCSAWTHSKLEIVLAHELAHVERRDILWHLVMRIACCVAWFNPLIWRAAKSAFAERERACDDRVLQSGVAATAYGQTLVEIAAGITGRFHALSGIVSIAEPPLQLRLRSILDNTILRDPMQNRTWIAFASSFIACSFALGIIRPFANPITAEPPFVSESKPETQSSDRPSLPSTIRQTGIPLEVQRILERLNGKQLAAEERETKDQAEQIELSKNWSLRFPENVQENEFAGVIVDEDGQPLAGAKVDLFPAFTGHETTTDKGGMFRYKLEYANKGKTVEVRFSKKGYSPIYRREQRLDIPNLRVILNSKTYLEGQIVDENNNPAPMATVIASHPYIWSGDYPSFDRENSTKTDENGHYRLYLNPEVYTVAAISKDHGVERIQSIELQKNEVKTLDLQLNSGVRFIAGVFDAETKEPVVGLSLYHRTNPALCGVSNADGLIEIANALPGDEVFEIGNGTPATIHGYYSCPTEPFGKWWSPDAKKPWHRTPTTEVGIMFNLSPNMEPIRIYVQAGVSISGKVTDPDGNPVARATVAPAKTGTGNSLTGDNSYSIETQEDGTYVVCLPPSGVAQYNLIAHDGTYLQWRKFASGVTEPFQTKPGQRIENVDIQLHRPATVRGRVTASDGTGLRGLEVRAHATDKRGNRYYDPTTKTNDDGTFELNYIRPGKHFIQVEPFWMNAEDAPSESSIVVELKEGETKEEAHLNVHDEK